MAMKPVAFDAYLKWYESHDMVVKSGTVGKKLLQKGAAAVNSIESQTAVKVDASVTVLDNHAADGSNTAKKVVPYPSERKFEQIEQEAEFEDAEMGVEDEELDGEWEKVGGGEEEEDGGWELV